MQPVRTPHEYDAGSTAIHLRVNGERREVSVEPWTTLCDALRERMHLTGTKLACNFGACGACTVHVNGRRILACMTLAIMHTRDEITTIEGLGSSAGSHPLQTAFVDCDALQCGYCTPGQIMSAAALIAEGHTTSDKEIKEWMSGNLCRCAAYPNILAAIKSVLQATRASV